MEASAESFEDLYRRSLPRVYAYVAYRIGPGPEAEDVTGDTFERAFRFRDSYDPARGEPMSWLIGIAAFMVGNDVPHGTTVVMFNLQLGVDLFL